MPFLGYLYYIISFFCFLGSIFIAFSIQSDKSLISHILIVYWGFCIFWLGWWFKRATCAHFGIFFSDEFEFENLSNYLEEKTGGKSHKFLWQLFVLGLTGYVLFFLK